ncbi:aminotransferase [Mycolicibacterium sp. S2-37]|uniref:aminotransferase n=1 Tax=Mycolicibacterium sp. S2-37 TaxID=2810297 RepID=UPI001A94DE55|nr:aminotransferase [Mycolicibacterium sp. S2-37]MBO0679510.1 aminotransferase [Mycolicibacterium sp. S2-37]
MSARRRTIGFNFFEALELPAPQIGEAAAEALAASAYGLTATAKSLGSQQDQNFLITVGNEIAGVLKIANPAFNGVEIAAQDAAAELIAASEPTLRIAVPLPNADGRACTEVDAFFEPSGGTAYVRLLRHLPGGTLIDSDHLSPSAVAALGDVAGRVSRALRDFEHDGLDRALQWDLRYGHEVVTALADHVDDAEQRGRLRDAARDGWARIERVAGELPLQAVHLDVTDANVVVSRAADGGLRPDGVIDFGDLTRTWAVSELAIAAASVLGHPGTGPESILPAVAAFHSVRPLTAAEIDALWPLLVLRTAVLIVSGAQQVALEPDNAYLTAQSDGERRMFEQAISVPAEVMAAVIRSELGVHRPAAGRTVATPMTAVGPVEVLDLSVTSDVYDGVFEPGGWLPGDIADRLARRAVDEGAQMVVTRFGEPRLDLVPALSARTADVVPTGVGVWAAQPVSLAAPWDGQVIDLGSDEVTLRGRDHEVTLAGVRPVASTGSVRAGEPLAECPAGRWTEVTVREAGAPHAPRLVRPELAAGWLTQVRDPAPLLGLATAGPSTAAAELVSRRDRSFAPVQEHYYRRPPQIERGWRHYLMSTAGRCYLDMVNNVTVLGHAHPRIADAAHRQLRRLNTNSRFNYAAVVEYSERLAATLPEPLDTVFLVNSGSEASDLAIRLALAATGRRDVVAMREAYHGWTYGTDAVSTSTADNPNALATRPDWVHTVESPNSFRGKYRGDEVGHYAKEAVAQIERMAADGRPPAGFICESVYGNAGGMALPDRYLEQVYSAVRAAGGYAIADEVQVGFGRLGHWFWGFQQQGVVPDIVSMAKSTGNGYPLGAVITSRAVADAFRSQGYFFSSTGGSPLSCAIGLTVLDVLAAEDLQGNAVRVGTHLKARLEALAGKHPIVGTVHGVGLYLGVEMVRDRETLEPATAETAAICERMLDYGVVIQPTGDHSNILKTKPPLCIDVDGADFYVDTLDRVLTEGW